MFSHLVRTGVAAIVGGTFLVGAACTQATARKSKKPDSGEEYFEDEYEYEEYEEDPETNLETNSKDAGVISVPSRPSDGGVEASHPPPKYDGGLCPTGVGPGDLNIVEVMIASRQGSGDPGEWVEIMNARDCKLNMRGVTISSPRGTAGVDSVTINEDLIVDPYKTFIVADFTDSSANGGLSGKVFSWGVTDVLRNSGDTIDVIAADGTTIVDRITYPGFSFGVQADQLPYGSSLAFPVNCVWSDRLKAGTTEINIGWWSSAQRAFGNAGMKGTPNDDNTDVACP